MNQCQFKTFCCRAPKICPDFAGRGKKQPVPFSKMTSSRGLERFCLLFLKYSILDDQGPKLVFNTQLGFFTESCSILSTFSGRVILLTRNLYYGIYNRQINKENVPKILRWNFFFQRTKLLSRIVYVIMEQNITNMASQYLVLRHL